MLSLSNIAAALGVGVIVGLVVSIYPAWIAFRVRPAQVLAGRPDTESLPARRLRQALSVLQIAAAMGLASFTLAVAWQTRFAIDGSPGFDPAPLLVFEMNEGRKLGADDTTKGFLAELAQQPAVAGVAISADAIGRKRNPWSQEFKREGGRPITIEVREISPQFFEEYGIRPVAGRLFDPKIDKDDAAEPVVLNEIAARELGFASAQQAVGSSLHARGPLSPQVDTMRVIGIAPDIRLRSLREAPTAVVYHLWSGGMTVTVRARGSVADAATAVRTVWPKYFPQTVLDMRPAKDIYAANYADDASAREVAGARDRWSRCSSPRSAPTCSPPMPCSAARARSRCASCSARVVATSAGWWRRRLAPSSCWLRSWPCHSRRSPSRDISRRSANARRSRIGRWCWRWLAALGVVGVAAARQARIAMRLKPAVALRT